jgi:hypothetical protein
VNYELGFYIPISIITAMNTPNLTENVAIPQTTHSILVTDLLQSYWVDILAVQQNRLGSSSMIRNIKSRKMRWAGHVERMGEKRNVCRLLVGKPKSKRPLGRPRRRWIDNIKMEISEIELSVVDWIGLAQVGTGGVGTGGQLL